MRRAELEPRRSRPRPAGRQARHARRVRRTTSRLTLATSLVVGDEAEAWRLAQHALGRRSPPRISTSTCSPRRCAASATSGRPSRVERRRGASRQRRDVPAHRPARPAVHPSRPHRGAHRARRRRRATTHGLATALVADPAARPRLLRRRPRCRHTGQHLGRTRSPPTPRHGRRRRRGLDPGRRRPHGRDTIAGIHAVTTRPSSSGASPSPVPTMPTRSAPTSGRGRLARRSTSSTTRPDVTSPSADRGQLAAKVPSSTPRDERHCQVQELRRTI